MMIEEQNEEYILRAKTGWTRVEGKDIGWWTGYLEKDDNVIFFATRITKNRTTHNPDFGKCRKEITRKVILSWHPPLSFPRKYLKSQVNLLRVTQHINSILRFKDSGRSRVLNYF